MTFDDDIVSLNWSQGLVEKKFRCIDLGLEWPPPENIRFGVSTFTRKRYSLITDEQRAKMTHVVRGAEYFEDVPANVDLG